MSDRRAALRDCLGFVVEVEQYQFDLHTLCLFVPREVRKMKDLRKYEDVVLLYARECYPDVRNIRLISGLWGVAAWSFYLGSWHLIPRYAGSKVTPELPAGRTKFRGPW